jgi:hypothetical protein
VTEGTETAQAYFDVDEVNALIPALQRHFTVILQLHAQVHQIYAELEQQGIDAEQELGGRVPPSSPAVARARALVSGLLESINEELALIQARGGQVKGLDPALVDFRAHYRGREVLLCWRLGEDRCSFWHDPEAGFAGRQLIVAGDAPGKPRPS